MIDYDAELQLHNSVLQRACDIGRTDRVLDIGCGTGQTTRDAARIAADGEALGVDIDPRMIEAARERARAAGLRNVTFEVGDAQAHPFPHGGFEVAISRFGTMFFADPVAAFTNIGRALRSDGRLVMMVWQAHGRNEWSTSIERALGGQRSPADTRAPDPFSLADPVRVERILQGAGFGAVGFADVDAPVYYGPDVDAALAFVRRLRAVDDALAGLDPESQSLALARLRTTLAEHASATGVWFGSRSWIVTARRPLPPGGERSPSSARVSARGG